MQKDEKVIWKDVGYLQLFALRIPFVSYVLTEDAIQVTSGIFLRHTDRIPLYRIAAKKVDISLIGGLFNCGTLHLITRGRDIPNIDLMVKDPYSVLKIIEEAEKDERRHYMMRKIK